MALTAFADAEGTVGAPQSELHRPIGDDAVLVSLLSAAILVEARDSDGFHHLQRVARIGMAVAGEIAPDLVADPGFLFGMFLHDLGNVALPPTLFPQSTPLTPAQWDLIRRHPLEGVALVEPIPFLRSAAPVIRWHHERWDGQGYPDRLSGESIPLSARIFAVCDAYVAMTSRRAHRSALDRGDALGEIERGSGSQFDPGVVAVFRDVEPRLPHPHSDPAPAQQDEFVAALGRLTARRWQVMTLATAGFSRGEIACLLGNTPAVVTNHLRSIRTRLRVDPRVRFAAALEDRLHPGLRRAASDLVPLVASHRTGAGAGLALSGPG